MSKARSSKLVYYKGLHFFVNNYRQETNKDEITGNINSIVPIAGTQLLQA